jgi:hypothetical protein
MMITKKYWNHFKKQITLLKVKNNDIVCGHCKKKLRYLKDKCHWNPLNNKLNGKKLSLINEVLVQQDKHQLNFKGGNQNYGV